MSEFKKEDSLGSKSNEEIAAYLTDIGDIDAAKEFIGKNVEEIKLSDFDRELTLAEIQQALKQLIILHNKMGDGVNRLERLTDQLDRENSRNRPFTL